MPDPQNFSGDKVSRERESESPSVIASEQNFRCIWMVLLNEQMCKFLGFSCQSKKLLQMEWFIYLASYLGQMSMFSELQFSNIVPWAHCWRTAGDTVGHTELLEKQPEHVRNPSTELPPLSVTKYPGRRQLHHQGLHHLGVGLLQPEGWTR